MLSMIPCDPGPGYRLPVPTRAVSPGHSRCSPPFTPVDPERGTDRAMTTPHFGNHDSECGVSPPSLAIFRAFLSDIGR